MRSTATFLKCVRRAKTGADFGGAITCATDLLASLGIDLSALAKARFSTAKTLIEAAEGASKSGGIDVDSLGAQLKVGTLIEGDVNDELEDDHRHRARD